MDVLLLSAGLGTRLQPLTQILPKCLMPIHGRPLLSLWLKMLEDVNVDRIFINTHHHSNLVRDYILSTPHRDRVTLLHEAELLGTAGTLAQFSDSFTSQDLMVVHADNLSVFDMGAFYKAYQNRPKVCHGVMMTFETQSPTTCGIVSIDEENRIIEFEEKPSKPKSNLANGAVYIFHREKLFEIIDQSISPKDISIDIMPHLIGKMVSYHNDTYHRDIGSIGAYNEAQKDIETIDAFRGILETIPSYWEEDKQKNGDYQAFKQLLINSAVPEDVVRLIMKK